MERKYQNTLVDGFAYLELKKYSATDDFGNQLKSKNGNLMLKIEWSAVDSKGNSGLVFDYIVITPKTQFKIDNLDNVLANPSGKSIYDQKSESFDVSHLSSRTCCGAVLKIDDESYAKVIRYVPLFFYKMILEKDKIESATPSNKSEIGNNEKEDSDMKKYNKELNESSEDEDDDYLPF